MACKTNEPFCFDFEPYPPGALTWKSLQENKHKTQQRRLRNTNKSKLQNRSWQYFIPFRLWIVLPWTNSTKTPTLIHIISSWLLLRNTQLYCQKDFILCGREPCSYLWANWLQEDKWTLPKLCGKIPSCMETPHNDLEKKLSLPCFQWSMTWFSLQPYFGF